ncbi:MAG: glycosyltransferase [Cyanomargarita calcarea GSE-NOS-MK-12-04C]|jgi:hypothetical protein|uniref:Glycosyltransferase n=1 Tax=Cyanomargarita calcarea GSE-NOS-MK-12-04C TaxID=2839659 RepID=A0A951USU8_9CYAN|nr:glycosyltransferase [Cyanomargarita calcarea GSE-NOS-MK-12-04C]
MIKSINANNARILVVSMRGCYSDVFRSVDYEFEDAICNFDSADILSPVFASGVINHLNVNWRDFLGTRIGKGKLFRLNCQEQVLEKKYDLLFFICQYFWDIPCINSIKKWRENCHKAVLWIDEIWAKELKEYKTSLYLEMAKDFDCIFSTQINSIHAIADLVKRPCYFLSYGIDAVKFCPYPFQPRRNIDVYNMGRRSPIVHKALLERVERENFLYLYDTLKGMQMINHAEHRILYSNLIKSSRYFIANKAKFDTIAQTGGQEELGSRFFEGAAGGAVIVGTPPACDAYTQYFDWSDAVISIPYDTANIIDILTELDAQPDRLRRIRKDNIVNSLLRHDWVYRWSEILHKVGLDNTPEMLSRQVHLQKLANLIYR